MDEEIWKTRPKPAKEKWRGNHSHYLLSSTRGTPQHPQGSIQTLSPMLGGVVIFMAWLRQPPWKPGKRRLEKSVPECHSPSCWDLPQTPGLPGLQVSNTNETQQIHL
jgi:hypothetical protein